MGKLSPPTVALSPQFAAVEERKAQPQSSGKPPDEVPRLGQLLADLMSERGWDRHETAYLCTVQPQTIKNALDCKSVNARFVLRLIDVFELRDRPSVLRHALISHLALPTGRELARHTPTCPPRLAILFATHLGSLTPVERCRAHRCLVDSNGSAPCAASRPRVAMRCFSTCCSRMLAGKEHLSSTGPRDFRAAVRGQYAASTSPTFVHGTTIRE